ncbi:MAG: hypothetical protein HY731_14395 [Candidatus Tectomicrobia bacterium]|nr:hypothetical protein [Candidatus Tectomicrobia bacterium]
MLPTLEKDPKAASPHSEEPAVQCHTTHMWRRDLKVSLLCLGAAILVGATFFFPLWALDLYAPQYTEGPLTLYVYPYKLEERYADVRGEIFEFKLLSKFIGRSFLEHPLELTIVPIILGVIALLCLTTAFLRRGREILLKAAGILFLLMMAGGAVDLQWRLYDFGHNRDPFAPLREIPPFTVPLIGSSSFANWKSFSHFEMGAYLFGLAALMIGIAYWCQKRSRGNQS